MYSLTGVVGAVPGGPSRRSGPFVINISIRRRCKYQPTAVGGLVSDRRSAGRGRGRKRATNGNQKKNPDLTWAEMPQSNPPIKASVDSESILLAHTLQDGLDQNRQPGAVQQVPAAFERNISLSTER